MRKFLTAGLLAAVAVPVLAQSPAPIAPIAPVAPRAAIADKVMTRADVDAQVRTHFARVDANRDGVVTTEEMTAQRATRGAHREGRRGQRMAQGAPRNPTAMFDRLDANRDGMIARDEFAKGREMRVERRSAMKHRGGGMMRGAMLKMADADRDGRITLAEATTGAMRHFDMVDANRDGRITPDERRAGRIHMKHMRIRQPG